MGTCKKTHQHLKKRIIMENIKPDVKSMKSDIKPKPAGYLGTGTGYAATTAIVKTSPTDKRVQVPNTDAAKMLKPGNTVIHSGTAFTVTEANQNSDQTKGAKMYLEGTAKGDKPRGQVLGEVRQKYPSFKLAAPKAPATPTKSTR